MKRWLLPLFLLLTSQLKAEDKQLPITDFSGGLNSYFSPLTIKDNQVKDSLNGLFDEDNAFTKRKGFTNCGSSKTYSYDSGWDYVDANSNDWLIVRSSDAIIASANPCTFTVVIATLTATDVVNAVNAFGRIYFVHRSSGVFYWDGATTTYIPGSPRGKFITEFRNRLWVAGLVVPTGNYLYASKYLDGSTWTTGSLSTDPFVLQIGLNDNQDSITGLFAGYNDMLSVFKFRSIFGIFGFDQSDFAIRALNKEIGTIDQRSIQPFMGGLVFASQRGFEFFDGFNSTLISKQVKDKTDAAAINSFNGQTWTQQVAADWAAGTFTPSNSLNSTAAAPALVLSTAALKDLNFAFGTFSNSIAESGVLKVAVSHTNLTNNGFETGSLSPGWTGLNGGTIAGTTVDTHCTLTPRTGSYAARSPNLDPCVRVVEVRDSTVLGSVCFTDLSQSCSYVQRTISMSGFDRRYVVITVKSNSSGIQYFGSDAFYSDGSNITFYTAADNYMYFDDFTNGVSTITSGYYISPMIDNLNLNNTELTTATMTPALGDLSAPATYPGVYTQKSSDGSSWSNITSSTGTNQTALRYTRYISSFTSNAGASSDINMSISTISIAVSASSGAFKSQIHNTGAVTAWGAMTISDTLNGGSIVYSICSSTNSNMGYPFSCASQTRNGQISVSTGTYVQWYSTFSITAATQTPTLSLGSVQWYTGTIPPLMASAVYDNRYWVSLSTYTDSTANTGTLVLSKGPIWSLFDIKAGSFILRQGKLYHTNNAANGKVYLDWQGYNDDNSSINAYIRSKDYMPEGWMVDKLVRSLHILAEPLGVYTLNSSYELDRSGTSYSFDDITVDELSGKTSLNLYTPKSTSYAPYGRSISIKFSNNVVDQPLKIYGGNLVYSPREIIQ